MKNQEEENRTVKITYNPIEIEGDLERNDYINASYSIEPKYGSRRMGVKIIKVNIGPQKNNFLGEKFGYSKGK